LLTVGASFPEVHALPTARFTTIRVRLLNLGARVIDIVSRVRLAFAAACRAAILIRHLAA
jgi:hypothetical protein